MTRTRLALALYVLIAAAYLWPIPVRPAGLLSDAPIHTDGYLFLWNAWWLTTWGSGAAGGSVFACDRLFFPSGCDLAFHTLSPLSAVPSVVGGLVAGTKGMVFGLNLRVFASFVLAAWVMYRLARRNAGRLPAFVAGLVFSFTAYHLHEAPRLHLVGVEWIPWIMLTGLRLFDRPSWRRAVPFGVVVAAAFWDAPDYALYAVLFFVPAAVWRTVHGPGRGRILLGVAGSIAVFAALAFPAVWARAARVLDHRVVRSAEERADFSLAPVDVLLPDRHHPVYGRFTERDVATPIYRRASTTLFAGFVPLLLVLAGLGVGRGRRRVLWVTGLAVALVLAVGPRLAIGDASPHGWLERAIPALGASRTPIRFVAVVWMFVALLAAEAFGACANRRYAWLGVAALVAAVFLERGRVPLRLEDAALPAPYEALVGGPAGAVLNLPLETVNHDHLGQIVHGRALVAGNIPRADGTALALALRTPVLSRWMAGVASGADAATLRATARALAASGVPYVTLNTTLRRLGRTPPGRDHGALATELVASGFRVMASDERVTVYGHRSLDPDATR